MTEDPVSTIVWGSIAIIIIILFSLFFIWIGNLIAGQQGMVAAVILVIVILIGLFTLSKK